MEKKFDHKIDLSEEETKSVIDTSLKMQEQNFENRWRSYSEETQKAIMVVSFFFIIAGSHTTILQNAVESKKVTPEDILQNTEAVAIINVCIYVKRREIYNMLTLSYSA